MTLAPVLIVELTMLDLGHDLCTGIFQPESDVRFRLM